jgi:hypothetical protein
MPSRRLCRARLPEFACGLLIKGCDGDLLSITTPRRLQRCNMVRGVEVRVAGTGDIGAIASLRSLWSAGGGHDRGLERRLAEWLTTEGDRRTTGLPRSPARRLESLPL